MRVGPASENIDAVTERAVLGALLADLDILPAGILAAKRGERAGMFAQQSNS